MAKAWMPATSAAIQFSAVMLATASDYLRSTLVCLRSLSLSVADWISLFQLLVTVVVAVVGYGSFRKWQKEKIAEKKIDVALEALALAYESEEVFKAIQASFSSGGEIEQLEKVFKFGGPESGEKRFYQIVLARIIRHQEFFERAAKLRPRFMAIFGQETSNAFRKLSEARNNIAIAAEMLIGHEKNREDDKEFWLQLKSDVIPHYAKQAKEGDRTAKLLSEFRSGIESVCFPLVYGVRAKR